MCADINPQSFNVTLTSNLESVSRLLALSLFFFLVILVYVRVFRASALIEYEFISRNNFSSFLT